jgi:hypothetical protein
MITFEAEVIRVEVKKTISVDREFKVVLITDDPKVLELAAYVNAKTIKVEVKE